MDFREELNKELKKENLEVRGFVSKAFLDILQPDALAFIAHLTRKFSGKLQFLLQRRKEFDNRVKKGLLPDFLPETKDIREGNWRINTKIPKDLTYRRTEITGPVDRKMIINALNSGADVFMADFEDAFSPFWISTLQGQINLKDAVNRSIEYVSPEGKRYTLKEELATLMVRPRGLHLPEKHFLVDGKAIPACLFDFGLYIYHNHKTLLKNGTGPYFYLPKLESHLEARWWAEVFSETEEYLKLPKGTIKVSVLIETLPAAFEMDEIIYELRDYITALNLGRWDYIFSFIKKLGHDARFILPNRSLLTMDKHFLKSAALLLVNTCHRRGAYAIGGMAANVPIKGKPEVQEQAMKKVKEDKLREISQGFDGAWVAHPDLVPLVKGLFEEHLKGPNQLKVIHEDLKIKAEDLLTVPEGEITLEGLRANINVGLRYLESWLRGIGCVAINYLMEDTATVEICRAQLWQWYIHKVSFKEGKRMSKELFQEELKGVLNKIKEEIGYENYSISKFDLASDIFSRLVTSEELIEFMPLVAYDYLD
ncbi:Malate synthase A [archaeon HR06]|nr:Malate synthase A [archaeon HR06]